MPAQSAISTTADFLDAYAAAIRGVELGDVDAGGLAANDVRDRWADPIDPYDLGPLSDDTSGGRV
jgi:hypothetical protein